MIRTRFRNEFRNNLRKGLRTVLIACPLSAGLTFASGAAFAAAQPAHDHGSPVQLADAHGSRPLPVYGRAPMTADACHGASPRGCRDDAEAGRREAVQPLLCLGASPRGCLLRPASEV